MRIYLSRWTALDVGSNLRRVAEEADEAARAGAELCVFPESFLHGYARRLDPSRARAVFEAISRGLPSMGFCFGSLSEGGRNRMTFWTEGREIARYDKVHLFGPNQEPAFWAPGDRYAAVRFAGWTFGLINCNDVRFPEQARALRLEARADALLAVAWWPWRRDHVWATLLRARAIENGVFSIGCCVSGSEVSEERFAGAGNHVFDPLGEPVRTEDDRVYELDRARLEALVVDPLETWVRVDRVEVFPRPPGEPPSPP